MLRSRLVVGLLFVTLAACAPSAPPDLGGTWESTGAPGSLELRGNSWTLISGRLVKSGVFRVTPRRIAFLLTDTNHAAFERYCRDVVDVYEWRLDGARLVLRPVDPPLCDPVAESVLIAGAWVRQGEEAVA